VRLEHLLLGPKPGRVQRQNDHEAEGLLVVFSSTIGPGKNAWCTKREGKGKYVFFKFLTTTTTTPKKDHLKILCFLGDKTSQTFDYDQTLG
jgi:hypothetical protein